MRKTTPRSIIKVYIRRGLVLFALSRRCAQYFKIAIGMGVIWTFEILSQIAEGKGHFW